MTTLIARDLKVNDKVIVASWRSSITSQGVYSVITANKIKIVLKRDQDGYERTWSVKRNVEMSNNKFYSNEVLMSLEEFAVYEAASALIKQLSI